MKRALLIGDGNREARCSAEKKAECLREVFENYLAVDAMENYDTFSLEKMREYKLLIFCTEPENWKEKRSGRLIADIITYTVNGGGILGIHNGLLSGTDHEMNCLWGASLRTKLPAGLLDYKPVEEKHLILDQGCVPFSLEDEPIIVDIDIFAAKCRVLYNMQYGAKVFPAVWINHYGSGRIACVVPGHGSHTFLNAEWQRIVLRSGRWAAGLL